MTGSDELLRRGIEAAKAGQVAQAHSLLKQVVEQEPRNEKAWLWLSGVVETDEQRLVCLQNALAINPHNMAAKRGLAALRQKAVAVKPLPEKPVSQPPSKRWYREGWFLLLIFCLFTPLWVLIVLTDPDRSRGVQIFASIILIVYIALICPFAAREFMISTPTTIPIPTTIDKPIATRKPVATSKPTATPGPQLALLSLQPDRSPGGGYFIVEGEVKNISGLSLDDVVAIVSVYDSDRNFITSDTALIEYTTLLPGQTSPFEVMVDYNPKIEYYKVEFKHLLGGRIQTRRDDKPG